MGLMGIKLPGIELCIALSAVALGFAVFCEARPKLWVAAIIVGVFAIAHAHAHGTELPLGASGVLYSIGFVIATGLLHALGIGIGLVHRWPAGRIPLRVAGAVVAMGGVLFLWKAISGEAGEDVPAKVDFVLVDTGSHADCDAFEILCGSTSSPTTSTQSSRSPPIWRRSSVRSAKWSSLGVRFRCFEFCRMFCATDDVIEAFPVPNTSGRSQDTLPINIAGPQGAILSREKAP